MNLKDLIKNKKVIISITTVAAILVFAIISLLVSNMLSGKVASSDKGDVSSIDHAASDLKKDGLFDITALSADSTGVDLNSGFKILCKEKQSESFLKQALTVSPQQNYQIKKISDKEFHLNFIDTLKAHSIYKIDLKDNAASPSYSWAFQTKKAFTVVRTLPGDRSAYVPVNSGIEISFSHEGVKEIEKYFRITPKVTGRFEFHYKTVVFIPEQLAYDTIYTVILKKGLGITGSEQTLSEDYTFTFETRKSPEQEQSLPEYLNFTDVLNTFTPQAIPALEVYASQHFKDIQTMVEVYKYESEDALLENLKQYDNPAYRAFGRDNSIKFDTDKLQKVHEFSTKVMNYNNDYWGSSYVVFPSCLPEGHYLINVKSKDTTYQTHVQVNDLSVYAMAGTQENLVWVNRSSTGEPVEQAVISADGIQPVKTTKDGVAIISKKTLDLQKNHQLFLKISKDQGPSLLAPLFDGGNQYYADKNAQKYWTYLYFDRDLYLPTDTIQIWGMVKPRNNGNLSSKATLSLLRADYYYDRNTNLAEILSKEIDISELGTFKSELELSNFNAGSYFIQLKLGDNTVIQRYFDVRQYIKPAYNVDITPDKKVMFEWEKVNMDIHANFFEGSPVPGLQLSYDYYTTWDTRKQGNIVCNEDGKTNLEISPQSSQNSWHPFSLNLYLTNAKAEEEQIYTSGSVMVFPRDTMIEVETSSKDDRGKVEINTNLINLTKLKTLSGWWHETNDYRGNTVDASVKIRLYQCHWNREETGEYYDFINKKKEKTYRYFEVKNLLQEFDANTIEGKCSYEFPLEEKQNYYVEVQGVDSRNSTIIESAYLYRYPEPSGQDLDRYSITDENNRDSFKLGDKVSLVVKKNNTDLSENTQDRFLYMILKSGLLSYEIKTDPDYSFIFTKQDVPNVHVKAVYFDGTNVFNVESKQINYDYNEGNLKIDIKPDKQAYKPGDTVQMDIHVEDMQGIPCSAEINLSVVDEAFFAVHDQHVDTLASLYRYCFDPGILSEYVSYKPLSLNMGFPEQGGEGGDESIRSAFKDNAFFDTVKTDGSGNAKATFKLPDDLTSWRVTYQGITADLKAGSGRLNVPVTLPFFVDVMFNNIFIDGDTVCISARSFGTKLENDKNVEYTVSLNRKDGEKKAFSAQGNGGKLVNIELGKLEEGDYSVTVTAKQDGYNDGIKRDFKVVQSMLEAGKLNYYKLSEHLNLEGGTSLTTLSFYNEEISTYYNTLLSLAYTWGERVDQKLSRKIASELIKKHFGEEIGWREDDPLDAYQQNDGGIAQLTYGSSNPEVTAKVSSLAKDLFDSTAMKWYFYKTLENNTAAPEDVAASLWGLAALNEPVLIDIRNLLPSTAIGTKEKLYLGLGLAEMGDYKGALDVYNGILKQYGVTNNPYVYLDIKTTRDDTIALTSLCAVLAAKIDASEKDGLFKYVQENSTRDILTNMERLLYITHISPDTVQKGSFTVEVNGDKKHVTLDKNEIFKLVLTPQALQNIKFSDIMGDIAVSSSFIGPVKDLVEDENKLVTVKRTYNVDGKSGQRFKQSDLLQIVLAFEFAETAPDGYYEITDILPAGLRYVSAVNLFDQRWHPNERDGQKIRFGFYYDKNSTHPLKSITYYARSVTPGLFTADYTFAKHSDSDVFGFAEKVQVEISK
ncbi:Ig-like domain-containing alpha-2-macroglobulin family protein [Petroclostridium sp. X23]|uniref:Ig-like domain-containing alpha-2-macroglobulin family protein n=1 Tax=Petroclostridium sp. X23 TaxID=3045146 RepID=UPI0024ACD41E|nr:Ig-like domain-containing alpha-2-macroglobulin family protein [Petroclostridium sp. X23]WHH57135.1 Ig-like domain-containing protein [Petroclostridium sp. X23]